jgi:Animal haem peroxidase
MHDGAQLEKLACAMKDSRAKRQARAKQNANITTVPSGYVYLGQFIDHDITKDNRYLADAIPDVKETRNFRTARLDLEMLYGRDPASIPCIYEDDGERLKLGPTMPVTSPNGTTVATSLDDLPRLSDGTAIIVDPRNDENLIVAQMHVLFIKFHNRVLRLLKDDSGLAPAGGGSPLEQARRFVTWHYQWIVLHEFLPAIARKSVLDDINSARSQPKLFPQWFTPSDAPVSLPIEFSVAAFRFGHSMVRDRYELNGHIGGAFLSEIVRMTKRGGGVVEHLPANYVIDWDSFFGSLPARVNHAEPIDRYITEMLYDLPKQTEEAFRFQFTLGVSRLDPTAKMMPPLPETTLKRGSAMCLPSGEEFARRFGLPSLDPAELFPQQEQFFEKGLNKRTPLWYYLLAEAELEPSAEPLSPQVNRQSQLGTIGSGIVAETLYQLLNADQQSIANDGRDWRPPTFTAAPGGRCWCLDSMENLIRFVGM